MTVPCKQSISDFRFQSAVSLHQTPITVEWKTGKFATLSLDLGNFPWWSRINDEEKTRKYIYNGVTKHLWSLDVRWTIWDVQLVANCRFTVNPWNLWPSCKSSMMHFFFLSIVLEVIIWNSIWDLIFCGILYQFQCEFTATTTKKERKEIVKDTTVPRDLV